MSKLTPEEIKEYERQAAKQTLEHDWGSPRHWRAWGSWFSWGSPVGLGLFFIAISFSIWILTQL